VPICFGRLAGRGWPADAFCKDLLNEVVFKKRSITNLIENSDVWKAQFNENVGNIVDNPASKSALRIKSLALAKHRHDSVQTPLGRAVPWLLPKSFCWR